MLSISPRLGATSAGLQTSFHLPAHLTQCQTLRLLHAGSHAPSSLVAHVSMQPTLKPMSPCAAAQFRNASRAPSSLLRPCTWSTTTEPGILHRTVVSEHARTAACGVRMHQGVPMVHRRTCSVCSSFADQSSPCESDKANRPGMLLNCTQRNGSAKQPTADACLWRQDCHPHQER